MKIMGTPDVNAANTVVRELNLPLTPEQFLGDFRSQAAKVVINCKIMAGIMANCVQ